MAQLNNTQVNGNLNVSGNISLGASVIDKTLLNLIYPVGTLYWTNNKSFDPNTSFGGKWTRITDKFILAGNSAGNNLPGENATGKIKLTETQLPAHSHYYTPSGSVSSSFTGTRTTTEDESKHTHNFYWSAAHSHNIYGGGGYDDESYGIRNNAGQLGGPWDNGYYTDKFNKSGNKVIQDTTITINKSTGTGSSHNHYYTPSGSVSSSFTGTRTTTEKTGSGSEINIMPPYTVRYCWERNPD